jgi:hypothetical protein
MVPTLRLKVLADGKFGTVTSVLTVVVVTVKSDEIYDGKTA